VGGGSHSGRSMRSSLCTSPSCRCPVGEGRRLAVCAGPPSDVRYGAGTFRQAARPSTCGCSRTHGKGLESAGISSSQTGGTYGSHVCEVEVDADTGRVAIVAWTGVDDVGLAINRSCCTDKRTARLRRASAKRFARRWLTNRGRSSSVLRSWTMLCASGHPAVVHDTDHGSSSELAPDGRTARRRGGTTPRSALSSMRSCALAAYGVTDIAMPATSARLAGHPNRPPHMGGQGLSATGPGFGSSSEMR
jgi:carbon-monoxide dehydrogenase large subunit